MSKKITKKTAARRPASQRVKNPLREHPLLEHRMAGQLDRIDRAVRAMERDVLRENAGINADVASSLRGAVEGVRARVARLYPA